MWIDKETFEVAKVEAETIDNITFGLGAIRLNKGMHLAIEQSLVNGEVWFPTELRLTASARAVLFFGVRVDVDQKLHSFKKYSVDSTITVAEER
jgi:hypothetical protein